MSTRTLRARWRSWDGTTTEEAYVHESNDGVLIQSEITGIGDGRTSARYVIECDALWRVRRFEFKLLSAARGIDLLADGEGRWSDPFGTNFAELDRAIDIDISVTPLTNTLPIRRLNLDAGQSADISVAYIEVPRLAVSADPQRYTCLVPNRRYRFESLDSDFVREIEVDDDALVLEYPGLFTRIAD